MPQREAASPGGGEFRCRGPGPPRPSPAVGKPAKAFPAISPCRRRTSSQPWWGRPKLRHQSHHRFYGQIPPAPQLFPGPTLPGGRPEGQGPGPEGTPGGLDASFVLEGQKLAISRADLQLAGLAATLRGTLTQSGVDVTFNASVSGSRTLPLPPGAAFASLKAEGATRGPWKAPQVSLTAPAARRPSRASPWKQPA